MMKSYLSCRKRQQGLATLSIAMMLLFIITIVSLSTARISITEQLVSNNLYREKQAFEAAQAGLETALDSIKKSDFEMLPASATLKRGSASLGNGATYSYSYQLISANQNELLINVVAMGYADNDTSMRTVQQSAVFMPPLDNTPIAPLTSRNSTWISGVNLTNPASPLLVHSGGAITSIPLPQGVGCTQPASCITDPGLSGMGKEDFFEYFFGLDKISFQGFSEVFDCSECGEILDGQSGKIAWLTNAGKDPIYLDNSDIGSQDDPVILMIEGDLGRIFNTTIHGLVYITGKIDSYNGNFEIVGALISEDSISLQGNILLEYNTTVLANLDKLGHFARIAGSWRDF